MTRVVVLGAGPAGLAAALGLAERGFEVDVLERAAQVGGNTGSFELEGVRVDYGSHRLHPAADPRVLGRLRSLLGTDLLARPRHGRIRLGGRWIRFPLRPLDLALRLPPGFAAGATLDLLRKRAPRGCGGDTFASVLERGLGPTICREFYFPYARKIWGLEPEQIDAQQARRRVAAGSAGRLLRRLVPSRGTKAKRIFYYPRRGFGQIAERLAEAADAAGARIHLGKTVEQLVADVAWRVRHGAGDIAADHVWSTIPLTTLARLVTPPPPADVQAAGAALAFRAMLLVYVVLDTDRFSPFDAHYFPEVVIPFTRVSEPKNYAARTEPAGRTVLCAELPCAVSDPCWSASDDELGRLVTEGLARAGLPVSASVLRVLTRRLPHAYPIYARGYQAHFDALDRWAAGLPGLLSFGRQGLFAHDNTHHAMAMAHAAVDCLADDGGFDAQRWALAREGFQSHVVED